MNAIPTMPRKPWDYTPSEEDIARARGELERFSPATRIAASVFTNGVNVSDLRFIALAVLELSDRDHEQREIIRRLEERVRLLEERIKG